MVILLLGFQVLPILAESDQSIINLNVETGVTPPTPTPTPTPTPGGGGIVPPENIPPIISDVTYTTPDVHTIIIEWKTNEPATTELEYGLTPDYELGKLVVEPESLPEKHKVIIRDLISDETYYFRPRAKDLQGNEAVDKGFSYHTPDIIPPANVSSLKAIPGDEKITLEWKNPSDKDFNGVKIIRSLTFFPLDIEDGDTVYDGNGQTFIDNNLENGRRYYYTVFSYDKSGNFSSGAIVSEVPRAAGAVPTTTPPTIPPEIIPPTEVPTIPPELIPPLPKEKVEVLDLNKILVFTAAKDTIEIKPDAKDSKIKILPDVAIKASIKKELLSPFLKSIILTLGESSYLLKINKEKNVYETDFITPGSLGSYALNALVLIYKDSKVQLVKGKMDVENPGYVYKAPDDKKEARVSGADVTLYQFNNKTKDWQVWVSSKYFQVNPEVTDSVGEYAFLVTPGKYYLAVSRSGYESKKTDSFEANNIINQKISLKQKPFFSRTKETFNLEKINFGKILFWLIIIIIILLILKKIVSRRRGLREYGSPRDIIN